MFRLEGAVLGQAEVVGLVFCKFGKFAAEGFDVEARDLFVQLFWQAVDVDSVFFGPEFDLGQHLVAK